MAPSTGPTIMGIDVVMVASLLAAIATFAVLVAIYAATTVRDPMAKRVKALNERREQLKAGIVASTTKRAQGDHQPQRDGRQGARPALLAEDAAGKPGGEGAGQADAGRHPLQGPRLRRHLRPAGAAGGDRRLRRSSCVYLVDYFPEWGVFKRYGLVAGTLILSYKAPDIWLKNKVTKRTHAIRKGLPDALDLLVICAEAGLTVDAAFGRVARELGKAYPELGDEFALTSIELGFLTDRRLAFENLAKRIDLDSVRGVVTTMIQTEKYGTPLASALRVLSAEFRNERMMRAEEKAARLPAIMTVPLILFILPVLFIVILGPASCSIHDALLSSLVAAAEQSRRVRG